MGGSSSEGEDGQMSYDDMVAYWAAQQNLYAKNMQSLEDDDARRHNEEAIQKRFGPDGTVEHAVDNTDQPLYDTRVWLHMYEGEDGLTPSFCRRTGDAQYMYDFTGFKEWRVEQNALLSDQAKCLMFKLWKSDPELWNVPRLASLFRIRQQRALAICKIKEEEFEHSETCTRVLNKLQRIFGLTENPTLEELRRDAHVHTPRHLTAWFDQWLQFYEMMPRMVHPDSVPGPGDGDDAEGDGDKADGVAADADGDKAAGDMEAGVPGAADEITGDDTRKKLTRAEAVEVVALHNFLARAANGEAKQIATHEDLWRCMYHMGSNERYIPMVATMPSFEALPAETALLYDKIEYEEFVEKLHAETDEKEIEEFTRNLSWSLGETGQSIQREPRKRGEAGATLPAKPEGGWPILVTPLKGGGERGKPFVALPDARHRELTEDEALYLEHFKREPKIFSRPRRHAPFTNDTLHMFTQRKPNTRHDLYNPPYKGGPKRKTPTSGPSRAVQRRARMRANASRKDLERRLAGLRL